MQPQIRRALQHTICTPSVNLTSQHVLHEAGPLRHAVSVATCNRVQGFYISIEILAGLFYRDLIAMPLVTARSSVRASPVWHSSWTIVQSSQSAASNIECNLVQQYCRRYANRNVLDSITREFPGPTAEDAASVQYANSNEMFCCRDFRFATYPSS